MFRISVPPRRLQPYSFPLETLEARIAPATITVNTLADDLGQSEEVSLREAILLANDSPGADVIVFAPGLTGNLTLSRNLMHIDGDLTIDGPTVGGITISAAGNSRIFYVSSGEVTLSHLGLTEGLAETGVGGAILVSDGAHLTLDQVSVTNSASNDGGGGLAVIGQGSSLTIKNSVITENQTLGPGGGVYAFQGALLVIENSTISTNYAFAGGGIFLSITAGGDMVKNSTISGNEANSGGGIYLGQNYGANVTFDSVAILGNLGGGIWVSSDGSPSALVNSTVSGNQSPFYGGGLHIINAAFSIKNSTIAFNQADLYGGGIQAGSGARVDLVSTIVSNNGSGQDGPDLGGNFTASFSLVQNTSGALITDAEGDSMIYGQDPRLRPLANNGGPTQTHSLEPGSPAINAGSNAGDLLYDQRGAGYARSAGDGTDIGAIEFGVVDLAVVKSSTAQGPLPAGASVSYSITVTNSGPDAALSVQLRDVINSLVDATFDADSSDSRWAFSDGGFTLNVGPLAPGASATVVIAFTLKSTFSGDIDALTNTATAKLLSSEADRNPENDSSSVTYALAENPQLVLSVRDGFDGPGGSEIPAPRGDFFTYTITVGNLGKQAYTGGRVAVSLGSNVLFADGNGIWTLDEMSGVYSATLSTVPADEDAAVTLTMDVRLNATTDSTVTRVQSAFLVYKGADGISEDTGDAFATESTLVYQGIFAVAPGVAKTGRYAPPVIRVFDVATGTELAPRQVYPNSVRDSLRMAMADVNNDGYDDIIITTEKGRGAVRILDGFSGSFLDNHPLSGLRPFGIRTGAFVATGDLDNPDGLPVSEDEIVFGSSLGGGAVKIYNLQTGEQRGPTIYPFGVRYKGGVRVAIGDVDGDGAGDLVTAQGNFGNVVRVFGGGDPADVLTSFRVGGARYLGGVNLTVGDIDGDGRAEIVTGRNRLSAATVEVFKLNPLGAIQRESFFNAYGSAYQNGVRLSLLDLNADGTLDLITGPGYGGGSQVKFFDGISLVRSRPRELVSAFANADDEPQLPKNFVAFSAFRDSALWVASSLTLPTVQFGGA